MKVTAAYFLLRRLHVLRFVMALVLLALPVAVVAENGDPPDADEVVVEEQAIDDSAAVAGADAKPIPTDFPSVELFENSRPLYAAFRLDPWAKNILYILFDGNAATGYRRMYAWVTAGSQYAEPTPFMIGAEDRFPAISWRETEDNEVVTLSYTFRTTRSVGGRGGGTSVDYLTGEERVSSRRTVTNINHYFNLEYTRDRPPTGGPNQLHMIIPSRMSMADEFKGLRPHAPWNGVTFLWDVEPLGAEANEAVLRIEGRPWYGARNTGRRVTIRALPPGFFDVDIAVAPYMKDPVFTQRIPIRELERDGLEVRVPFTWYSAAWSAQKHVWLGGNEISGSTRLMPLGRDRAGSPTAGGGTSPTSVLRGPPPSLLRGPDSR